MSPAAFEALDCLCPSLLLYMKHGAVDSAGGGEGHFNLGVHTLVREERCDIKARRHPLMQGASLP